MKGLIIKTVGLIVILGCMMGCSSSGEEDDLQGKSPILVTSSPANGSTDVIEGICDVVLTFDRKIQKNTLACRVTVNGKEVASTNVVVNISNSTLSIKNVEVIRGNVDYTIVVAAGSVKSYQTDVLLAADIILSFTSRSSAVAPNTQNVQALTNVNASVEAQNVYNFLKDNYGVKMISGAQSATGNGDVMKYPEYINTQTGEYPTIVGFDYIFLNWVPCNWVSYDNITFIQNHWNNNGLVAISWHWNVPSSSGETDMSKYGFYIESADHSIGSGGTSFDIREALIDGTWQHDTILSHIKKLATKLQLLEDAKIPILWRPLHEAAGDYTWGAWFWWGAKGVEYTKQLWKLLYDQLTNVYGLDNLIWVWTVQTSNAGNLTSLEKIQAAYPGNEYVDIVGADLYENAKPFNRLDCFNLINDLVDGKKMITLSECGNLPNVDNCFANGETWSFFMSWCDGNNANPSFLNWNNQTIWSSIITNSHVINRKDMPSLK